MDGVRYQLMNDRRTLAAAALIALAAVACGPAEAGGRRSPSVPAGVVDSALPPDVALRRFREGLRAPDSLRLGAGSRDALIQRFVDALERRDTAALAQLLLDRGEFAYLYYPTVPEAKPPYDLSPGLLWFVIQQHSRKGLERLIGRRGGRPLGYLGYSCEPPPARHGENIVWGRCVIRRVRAPGDTVAERLFGPVLEHRGRFKFISYSNTL